MLSEFLSASAKFFDVYYDFIVLALLAIAALTLRRRLALFGAMFLVVLLLLALKPYYAQLRPCTQSGVAGFGSDQFACPADYGMPSGHAASSMLFVLASLGTGWFFFFAPLAAFISFTRVYAGLHTFPQVAAGVALGFFAWAFSLSFVNYFAGTKAGKTIIKALRDEEWWIRKTLGLKT